MSVLAGQPTAVGRAASTGAAAQPRPIWLCADDYGISPSVNKAIRDLVVRGRLNATSVMVVAPSFTRSEAASLAVLNAGTRRVAIGLHVTLTAPFKPRSVGFRPLRGEQFLPLEKMLMRGTMRMLDPGVIADEIQSQFNTFVAMFGRAPDFIDGHQHVQLFPQVREALLHVVMLAAPQAWVRQCGRVGTTWRRFADRKALLLDLLSRKFRSLAASRGVRTNPAFAGAYDFASAKDGDFAALFSEFLKRLPANGVVMCHPGFVDAELERLDPLTVQREREYAFLADDAFLEMLRVHGVTLARVDGG
jgi:predicted glycoside hydrolase/deacetylase ChbG (UPF0249 family)